MPDSNRFLHPEAIRRISRLDLRARHIVEGFLSGMHRSPYFGQSVEFLQHREYTVGDDLRHVDWKVWARQDRIYVKQFEEDTNLRCTLLRTGRFIEKSGKTFCNMKIRQSFFAGSPLVRMEVEIHNPREALHPGGLWDLGDPGSPKATHETRRQMGDQLIAVRRQRQQLRHHRRVAAMARIADQHVSGRSRPLEVALDMQ